MKIARNVCQILPFCHFCKYLGKRHHLIKNICFLYRNKINKHKMYIQRILIVLVLRTATPTRILRRSSRRKAGCPGLQPMHKVVLSNPNIRMSLNISYLYDVLWPIRGLVTSLTEAGYPALQPFAQGSSSNLRPKGGLVTSPTCTYSDQ
jgi:hypothetical protein